MDGFEMVLGVNAEAILNKAQKIVDDLSKQIHRLGGRRGGNLTKIQTEILYCWENLRLVLL